MSSMHPQSLHGQILGHDRVVMPSPLTSAIGQGMYLQDVRNEPKITLLSRPQQPVGTLEPSPIGTIAPPRTGYESFQNASMGAAQLPHSMPFSGRAARDDYFDTEDPSVNLHDFIINSMQSQKNRVILVKLEEEFVSYVEDVSRVEPLKLPPWDSYHRMLAHRVAAYFGLEHNVDQLDKKCVVVHKGPNTRLPQRRFADCMSKPRDPDDVESSEPKLILKRTAKEVDVSKLETILGSSSDLSGMKSLKTFEEREEEYERARARIFNQESPLESKEPSSVFDLETPSALTRRKSRILPAIMQHRRAASDTTAFLFNRGGLSDLLKEGPSSDHSSRSITPLLSQHHKSTEALARVFGSHQELDHLDQSPAKQLSPLTPRKQSQTGVVAHSPPKFSKSLSDYQPPSSAVETREPTSGSPTAVQFQPVQAGVPVIYQQPGAVIADPNWYPYPQQMMVYQFSPQGYVPAPHYSPIGPTVLQPGQFYAINQPYPTVPAGGITAAPVIAAGKDMQMSPQGIPARPGGVQAYEQYPSPTHPPGIALVRPIPQQPAPVRMASKPMGSWGTPVPQSYAIHPPVMVQPQGDQPPYATLVPYPQNIKPSQLADQMEGSLHLSGPDTQVSSESSNTISSESVPSSQFVKPVTVGTSAPMDSAHNVTVGGVPQNIVTGPIVSPTLPRGPVQFIPQQHPMYGGGPEAAFVSPGSQGSILRYPAGLSPQVSSPAQPTAPGPLNFPPGVLQARPQGVFAPSNAGLTHSPVQILGHTLGTSLFSPPPSSVSRPALFGQAVNGKGMGEHPSHPPIGTGAAAESPVGYSGTTTSVSGSQSNPLPPRLGRPQKGGANRYQNQRHPANRVNKSGPPELAGCDNVTPTSSGRKEALLPTPPSHHLVKLDTNLTCGVPVNVMELVSIPPDGSPEMHQAMQVLTEIGVQETKTGVMPKSGERVVIAVFESAESAVKALQVKHPLFVLSIPGNNHAKFILSLL